MLPQPVEILHDILSMAKRRGGITPSLEPLGARSVFFNQWFWFDKLPGSNFALPGHEFCVVRTGILRDSDCLLSDVFSRGVGSLWKVA